MLAMMANERQGFTVRAPHGIYRSFKGLKGATVCDGLQRQRFQ
jgi:hypothetical protein